MKFIKKKFIKDTGGLSHLMTVNAHWLIFMRTDYDLKWNFRIEKERNQLWFIRYLNEAMDENEGFYISIVNRSTTDLSKIMIRMVDIGKVLSISSLIKWDKNHKPVQWWNQHAFLFTPKYMFVLNIEVFNSKFDMVFSFF